MGRSLGFAGSKGCHPTSPAKANQAFRKVPGRETEEQVIVTNIDLAFIVHALDGSFNRAGCRGTW
jgi:hypothetical protein